jgi:protocatechuate 3,4-dioxygenase beta subunit
MKITSIIGAVMLAQQTFAHPGESAEQHAKDAAERRAYLNANKRSLAHCADALQKRGNDVAMHQRRMAQVEKARAKRAISSGMYLKTPRGQPLTLEAEKPYLRARDVDSVLNTDHHSNMTGITTDSDPSLLFSGNNSCVLSPEVTQGPYWVQGELVREDVTDGQGGVALTLDIQIIDVNTCEPVPEAFLEIWHCNSTGVYSGVVANGNGNTDDTSNMNNTFLRGIQKSNEDGVVTFETLFPGHYTGRATHIHVMTSLDATVNANETLSGGSVTHVGQMFFDQALIAEVDKVEPYVNNEQELTTNADDSILSEEATTTDPFIEYVLLGDSVADGLFGWLAFGMDTKASYNITPAAYLTENGGVENENSGMGGGMGGGPPGASGAPPNGTMPSGTMLAGASASGSAVSSTLAVAVSSSGASSLAGKVTSSASVARPSGPAPSDRPQRGDGKGDKGHSPPRVNHGDEVQKSNHQNVQLQQNQQKGGPGA